MKKLMSFVVLCCFGAIQCLGSVREVPLEKGLGWIYYLVAGLGAASSLICIIQGWTTMGNDAHKGKMLIAAGIGIPVFMAIAWYVFKNVLGMDLEMTSSL